MPEKKIYTRNNNPAKQLNNATGYMGYSQDNVISEIDQKFQPSIETNPLAVNVSNIVRGSTSSTSGLITVYTTPTDRDFYLTGITSSFIKDSTCDSSTGAYTITITPEGDSSKFLYAFPIITLTAQNQSLSNTYPFPIKLSRNSSIIFGGTFTVGVCVRNIGITGFTLDPTTYNIGQAEVH